MKQRIKQDSRIQMSSGVMLKKYIIYFLVVHFVFSTPRMIAKPLIEVDRTVFISDQAALDRSENGVDIVNMSRPSNAGVSKNTFRHYNVSDKGVILNNSLRRGASVLLGDEMMYKNPYYENQSASLVLFEVSGLNQSQLNGYTEMFGDPAEFILANPNGIVVNGGGLINIPRATFTTGQTVFGGDGSLNYIDVDRGKVSVDQLGFDASTVDYFDIVSRMAEINGELQGGNNLKIQVGQNRFDYHSRGIHTNPNADLITPKAQWGIDGSVLGVIKAGQITLIGTEDGVGVKTAGRLVAIEDIVLTSAGDIEYGSIQTEGDVKTNSMGSTRQMVSTLADGKINMQSGGSITLKGQLTHGKQGIILNTDKDIYIGNSIEQVMTDQGDRYTQLHSFNDVILSADGDILLKATYIDSEKKVQLAAHQGEVRNRGVVIGSNQLDIDAVRVFNSSDGKLSSLGDVEIVGNQKIVNSGRIESGGELTIKTAELQNRDGVVTIDEFGYDDHVSGIYSGEAMDLSIGEGGLLNDNNDILSKGQLNLSVQNQFENLNSGTISAGADMALDVVGLFKNNGTIKSNANLSVDSIQTIQNSGVFSGQQLVAIYSEQSVMNTGGTIDGGARLDIDAKDGNIENRELGVIQSGGRLLLNTKTLSNIGADSFISGGGIDINASRVVNNGSRIQSTALTDDSDIKTDEIFNLNGRISFAGSAVINAGTIDNQFGGEIKSDYDLTIQTSYLSNKEGLLYANGNLTAENINNNFGKIESGEQLTLMVDNGDFYNQNGVISAFGSAGLLIVNADQYLHNNGGQVLSNNDLQLNLMDSNYKTHGTLRAGGDLGIAAQSLVNAIDLKAGGSIDLDIQNNLKNDKQILAGHNLNIKVNDLVNNSVLFANHNMDLRVDNALNNHSNILAINNMTIISLYRLSAILVSLLNKI